MEENILIYLYIFIYGILIGSFLNVCIDRIPEGKSVVFGRSHCDSCNTRLRWYELIPIISYLFLKGRCRHCNAKLPKRLLLVEAFNGSIYVIIFWINGITLESAIYCLVVSALIVLSLIDLKTNTIPFGINLYIFILGLIRTGLDYHNTIAYLLGFAAVSGFLILIFLLTKGRGIGGGDIKLMAAAGLVLGWKLIIPAFFMGCIYGAIIHPIRMKLFRIGRELAFGPYLSAGILTAMLFGKPLISWYMGTFLSMI